MHAQRAAAGELRGAQEPVGGEDVPELAPGAGYEILLTHLHDLGAEAGGHPRPRIEVQLADPRRRRAGAELDHERVLVAVDRRRDHGVGVAAAPQRRRPVEQDGQAGPEGLIGAPDRAAAASPSPRGRSAPSSQTIALRSLTSAGAGSEGSPAPGRDTSSGRVPTPVGSGRPLELPGQRLEVRLLPGPEAERVVDRQHGLAAGLPRRIEAALVARP